VEPTLGGSTAKHLTRALRPHQWIKNTLLFVPILLAQQIGDGPRVLTVFFGFVAFCCVASFGYLINDLLDIEADRRHLTKKKRPFASGDLSIPVGLLGAVILLSLGFGVAAVLLSAGFVAMLGIYLLATLFYSFYLKEHLFADVLLLSGLYTHRVLSGGVAAGVEVSTWLLAFSVFFFLSLALLKRYIEVLGKSSGTTSDREQLSRRAYQPIDLDLIQTMGIASGYVSVLVLGLYISREDVTSYYTYPEALWLITPLMLYWISRVWFLARRGEIASDPVLFAATDRASYCLFAGVLAIGAFAAVWGS
jgi:4-hydroxybenzoate polyprenyltransferase